MKAGRTLTQLAEELERQNRAKRDFVAMSSSLELTSASTLQVAGMGNFEVSPYTHGQIAQFTDIPKKYYDRMAAEAPQLLTGSVNHWLHSKPQKRLVRTMDGRARALLSDRFRAYDNWDVANNCLEAFQRAECQVMSCEVTERRFYLKAVSPKISHNVGVGDIVQAGLVISNSEIGAGSLKVEPLIYRLSCKNGMISVDSSFRRSHAGKALEGDLGDGAVEFFTDETKRKTDEAVFLQIRDIVRATLTDEGFQTIVRKFEAAKDDKIEADPFQVVEVVQSQHQLTEGESRGILQHLIEERDMTRFGLVNAITRYSQDVVDYDRATEFERLGGKVLELPKNQWSVIANASA